MKDPACFYYNGRVYVALGGWLEKPKEEERDCRTRLRSGLVLERIGDEVYVLYIGNNEVKRRELLAKKEEGEGVWDLTSPWSGKRCWAIYSDYDHVYCVDAEKFERCLEERGRNCWPFSMCESIVQLQCYNDASDPLIWVA